MLPDRWLPCSSGRRAGSLRGSVRLDHGRDAARGWLV